jgi:hypothetical protein
VLHCHYSCAFYCLPANVAIHNITSCENNHHPSARSFIKKKDLITMTPPWTLQMQKRIVSPQPWESPRNLQDRYMFRNAVCPSKEQVLDNQQLAFT